MHWDGSISIGNVITAAILFLGFYQAHRQNITRMDKAHQQNIARRTEIELRLNLMFKWWQTHAVRGFRGDDE